MNVSGSAANKHMGNRLDSVLEDEAQLANKANASRLQSLLHCGVLGCRHRHYRVGGVHVLPPWPQYKPQFQDEYWRDVPAKGLSPAVIGRRGASMPNSQLDLTATLMHLSHIGAIRLDAGSYEAPSKGFLGMGGSKTVNDTTSRAFLAGKKRSSTLLDKKTMDLVFKKLLAGADSPGLAPFSSS